MSLNMKRQLYIGSFFGNRNDSGSKRANIGDSNEGAADVVVEPIVNSENASITSNTVATRKFQESWLKLFSWLMYDKETIMMICQFCSSLPHLAGGTDFISGNRHFEKETVKKHNDSRKHIMVRDMILSKQKGEYITITEFQICCNQTR